jgi:hypothetical protein
MWQSPSAKIWHWLRRQAEVGRSISLADSDQGVFLSTTNVISALRVFPPIYNKLTDLYGLLSREFDFLVVPHNSGTPYSSDVTLHVFIFVQPGRIRNSRLHVDNSWMSNNIQLAWHISKQKAIVLYPGSGSGSKSQGRRVESNTS